MKTLAISEERFGWGLVTQGGNISPIWGEAPTAPIETKNLHGGSSRRRNHVCKVSRWYFQGLRFYRGSNFPFSYWFLHGPYNSAAQVALPVIRLAVTKRQWDCSCLILARSTSAITANEKSSINTNRKSTTRLTMSLRWIVYVDPKGALKRKVSKCKQLATTSNGTRWDVSYY